MAQASYYNANGTLDYAKLRAFQNSGSDPGSAQASTPVVMSGSGGYNGIAQAVNTQQIAQSQMAAARQAQISAGYDNQIAKSQGAGTQAYQTLQNNYGAIAADASATRDRNMARVDQYGNSLRQDLDIKNKQALASASQSAISRGLGNMTIQDSAVRGQNFDNTRQQLSLEDQLLQNRISTDSNLSGAYQNVLQNQAQGLNSQANQNIQNDNSLASNKLGYLGGIQQDKGYLDVANLYAQQVQMDNANQQAALDRFTQSPQYQNPAVYGPYQGAKLGMPHWTR